MIHNEVFFDLRRGRVGITPAICPEYRDRPYHKGLPMIFRPGSMLRTENMVGISVLIVSFGVGIIIWRRCGCCCRQSLASSMDDTFKQGRTLHTIKASPNVLGATDAAEATRNSQKPARAVKTTEEMQDLLPTS
eukprot:TRINITY_DN23887_c0_g1_i1.p1 TRINITY_DN23887_c0_g1~~TRINITY_DN23887_c0_g1_i1.p1  ORF type:complete len:134 (-),score=7.44 TRINITY_DN23887_c0_g1_i1:9-410(-)